MLLRAPVKIDGRRVEIGLPAVLLRALGSAAPVLPSAGGEVAEADERELRAPLPGTLAHWRAVEGARVAAGEVVAMMDAMKMETNVTAPLSGTLQRLAPASTVLEAGQVIGRILPDGEVNR